MKILIILIKKNHRKIVDGLTYISKYLITKNILIDIRTNDFIKKNPNIITKYNIIYSPSFYINSKIYKKQKFIFGPQFTVLPDETIYKFTNQDIYIHPSEWVLKVWERFIPKINCILDVLPMPINTVIFDQINFNRENVFIYFKRRDPDELNLLKNYLDHKNIKYKIFDYTEGYSEDVYLNYLQNSKYGIILDAHESQGFAIEEALSCNVPLLVWNVKFMSQEYNSNYDNHKCSSIPYWDETCGEFFYESSELDNKFKLFISRLDTYEPRKYVLNNLSLEKCSEYFINLIHKSLSI